MGHPRQTTDGNPPHDDHWDGPAPAPIDPKTGQHKAYWVLPEEERKRGFVRPVRRSYTHVGPLPPANLRDLTAEEQERYARFGYAKFEEFPPERSPQTGRFWTQAELDRLNGCGSVTQMSLDIAETLARDPGYYSATFCCRCGDHLPIGEFVWDDGTRVGS